MDKAPTIPNERMMLEPIAKMMIDVITVIATRDIANPVEYITPVKHFLYTRRINAPRRIERPILISISSVVKPFNPDITSTKSLNVNVESAIFYHYPNIRAAAYFENADARLFVT